MPRRLPIGIQEFEIIRSRDYLYVDKTDIMHRMVENTDYVFFSRPRRFGKSLMVSTLEAYFQGKKELFEGLKIMNLESKWECHPVLRFQMPNGGYEGVVSYLHRCISIYEKKYGVEPFSNNIPDRFGNLLQALKEKTGKGVVVLIDEYNAPLHNTLYDAAEHERCRTFYREFFTYLKTEQQSLRYLFITGVSKFTQLSIFSALNNLFNITLNPEYETLCGITEAELHSCFEEEIEALGSANKWTLEETYANLKHRYDGYHFSDAMTDIYNPFSLICALGEKRLQNYWIQSGSTKAMADYFTHQVKNIPQLEDIPITMEDLATTDINFEDPTIFMFQTGYLTIKKASSLTFRLGIPNEEVRSGIYRNLLPLVVDKTENDVNCAIRRMRASVEDGDIAKALAHLQQLIAATPYSKMNLDHTLEEHFRIIITMAFTICGYDVRPEVQVSHGIIDLVVKTSKHILLFEIKTTQNGGIEAAKQQIAERGYVAAFATEPQQVCPIAIEIDTDRKQMVGFEVVTTVTSISADQQ